MKGTISRIMSYMLTFRGQLFFVFLAIALNAIANVASSYFLKPLINDYIMPLVGVNNPDFTKMIHILVVMGVIYLTGAVTGYLYQRIMVTVSTGTLYKIRVDLFTKLQALPIQYYDTHTHGEIMSRITNDTNMLRQMLSQTFPQVISSIIAMVATFIAMISIDFTLTAIVVGMMIVICIGILILTRASHGYFRRVQEGMGVLNGFSEEMLEGQRVIKVFNHESYVKADFAEISEELRVAGKNSVGFSSMLMPAMMSMAYVSYAICAMVGATMVINGTVDIGSVAAFLNYSRSFTRPLTQLSNQTNYILGALAGAERVFTLMDTKPEVDEGYVTLVNAIVDADGNITESEKRTGKWAWKWPHGNGTLEYVELKGDVRFEDVHFEYEEGKPVLNGISLFAKPGQKIALVGSTGAGKTTITNLINRFYDVPDGKIRYDGININKIKKDDLRRSLGVVLQDTNLFTGTVMDNIRYGKLDATDDEVIAAAKLANAHSFIRRLPQGYDTLLEANGGNLSQGQRQLLSIARAAVADPPVLILDEATSSIDTRTEHLIQAGMDQLMQGRTVFVIAHRLSTVRNSNAILVLEHGEVIERGDHESLIAEKGRYYQLYTGALELE